MSKKVQKIEDLEIGVWYLSGWADEGFFKVMQKEEWGNFVVYDSGCRYTLQGGDPVWISRKATKLELLLEGLE